VTAAVGFGGVAVVAHPDSINTPAAQTVNKKVLGWCGDRLMAWVGMNSRRSISVARKS
jgi:hypothetical protein